MSGEVESFDVDELLVALDTFNSIQSRAYSLYKNGPEVSSNPFTYDLETGRYTNEETMFTLVLGEDLERISDVMLIYAKSTIRMQKAIRNTIYFFTHMQSLRVGYQGEILLNWLKWSEEDLEQYLLIIDSYPEVRGKIDCVVASFADVKRFGLRVTKRANNRAPPTIKREAIEKVSLSSLDRVPAMKWRDVSFEDKAVVASYMDNEYGKHVREALGILMKFPGYNEWVAVGDGPGVVLEACTVLNKTCHSTDISVEMIDAGKKRGNKVVRCDAIEALTNTTCPIMIMYNSLSIHGLLQAIVDKFPKRKVIVVSATDAFEGRGGYRRYTGTSRLYYRNIDMPPGIKLKKSGPRPCNYTDFWDPLETYCIDNDRAYNVAKTFRRMSIPIKLSAYQSKYKEGMSHVGDATSTDVYMYDTRIQPAHKKYFNMNTGKTGKLREIIDHNEVDCGVYCTRGAVSEGKFLARDRCYRYYEFARGMEVVERHGARVRRVYFDNVPQGVPINKMRVPAKNNKRNGS
jgi:hypothetical protein